MNATPLIVCSGLRRTYRMGQHEVVALDGIDLRIDAGEFVAIVGPSGSGKSTLMYLLGCLDSPSGGSYRLRAEEVAHLDDAALSRLRNREIGYVFQQFFLLPDLDVVENVALGQAYGGAPRAQRRPVAIDLLTTVGLGERLGHRPQELSGGQMQRVAIARSLAMDPHLILADEPTGNLDTVTSAEIMALLRRLHAGGKTVVLVTHDREVARQADRVITLVDGAIRSDERNERAQADGPALAQQITRIARSGRLGFIDLLRMALREGVLAHKLRSLLTMLGIIFGIAAVIAMTAITEGGKRQQIEALRQIGMNTVRIRADELAGAQLMRARRLNPTGLSPEDLEAIATDVEGVEAATGWKRAPAEIRHGDRSIERAPVLGVIGAFQTVTDYHVAQGRFIDAGDQERFARVCVLGPAVADALELGPDPIGAVVVVGQEPFIVVGVMQRKAFGSAAIADIAIADRTRQVFVPYATMRRHFPRAQTASQLDAADFAMRSEDILLPASALMEHMIGALHHGAEDTTVSVPLEKLKQAQETKEVFNVIIVVIAGISLVVGGIGIMNIMLATVTERTHEIGIRRAIGASRAAIMAQFLAESALIAACGGLIGLGGGVLGGHLVRMLFGFPVAFSPVIMLVAAGVSMGVGLVFGLYPAWMAAQRDPVESLRA